MVIYKFQRFFNFLLKIYYKHKLGFISFMMLQLNLDWILFKIFADNIFLERKGEGGCLSYKSISITENI